MNIITSESAIPEDSGAKSLFSKYSYRSRLKRMELFYDLCKPDETSTLLDVGGEIDPTGHRQLQLIDGYKWKHNISALNNSPDHIAVIKNYYPEINAVIGDACQLPWPDKYFDIAYSNAVIEHVGSFKRQKQMSSEIMRVAKRWFVATPNRFYPFEFHIRLPFITWLPGKMYLVAGAIMRYNHIKNNYMFFAGIQENLSLLTESQFKRCFQSSNIIKQKITIWPETLIAVGGDWFPLFDDNAQYA